MATQAPSTSPLGFGLSRTFCTAVLPVPVPGQILPAMVKVTTLQPTLGLGTNPTTGALLPSAVSGRAKLSEDIATRWSTARGTLPDTKAPTTTGNYGVDILDSADADMTTSDAGRLAASLDAQARQDERVFYSRTTATLANSTLAVVGTLVDGAGPFKLTLSINLLNQNLQLLGAS